jgi:hypothetical protein
MLLALFLPLLVRLETASAILVVPSLVSTVLLISVVADLFVLVPAQAGRKLAMRHMPPRSVVVSAPVPGVVPIEIVTASHSKEVIGNIYRNIEAKRRREDELRRSREDKRRRHRQWNADVYIYTYLGMARLCQGQTQQRHYGNSHKNRPHNYLLHDRTDFDAKNRVAGYHVDISATRLSA